MTKTRSNRNRVWMACIYSFIFKCGSLYGEKSTKCLQIWFLLACSSTASRAEHICRHDNVDAAIKQNPKKGEGGVEVEGELALDMQGENGCWCKCW